MKKAKKIKKEYEISYSIIGGGAISITASSLEEAEELFYELDIDELIKDSCFDDGCEISNIE